MSIGVGLLEDESGTVLMKELTRPTIHPFIRVAIHILRSVPGVKLIPSLYDKLFHRNDPVFSIRLCFYLTQGSFKWFVTVSMWVLVLQIRLFKSRREAGDF